MKLPRHVKITMVDDVNARMWGVRWMGEYLGMYGGKGVYSEYISFYPESHHIETGYLKEAAALKAKYEECMQRE